MRSIEQIKAAGRFYKAGSIVPERVLSTRPKHKRHLVKFGSDCWVLGVNRHGCMVVAMECGEINSAVRLPYILHNIRCLGGKYVNGGTYWIGNHGQTDEQWAENIENALLK